MDRWDLLFVAGMLASIFAMRSDSNYIHAVAEVMGWQAETISRTMETTLLIPCLRSGALGSVTEQRAGRCRDNLHRFLGSLCAQTSFAQRLRRDSHALHQRDGPRRMSAERK